MKSFRTSLNKEGGIPAKISNLKKSEEILTTTTTTWAGSSKEEVLEEVEVRETPSTDSTKANKVVAVTLQEKV